MTASVPAKPGATSGCSNVSDSRNARIRSVRVARFASACSRMTRARSIRSARSRGLCAAFSAASAAMLPASSGEPPRVTSVRLTHSRCMSSGSLSRRTRRACAFWLVTRTRWPWASNADIRFAIVWVLPVPGGPSTTTPLSERSRSMIWACSGFAGNGNSGSAPSRLPRVVPCPSSHSSRWAGSNVSTSWARPSGGRASVRNASSISS